ncbi:MAG: glycosyltransferase family 2 protein [Telluria sp.]
MYTSAHSPARPVLSVIVPAYNAQDFIDTCLTAIAGQLGATHELLVIDDGSRDQTGELAEAVRARHRHLAIRIVRQPNLGVSAARNRGLREARGEYIVFVDADDLLLPGALAGLDDVIAHHRPDVIACDFQWWCPHKERKSRPVALGYPRAAMVTDVDAMLRTFFADRHMYVWANVMRRDIYDRVPQPVFPQGRLYEDVSVLSCLLSECRSLYRLAVPTIAYRQHPASLTKSISGKWCVDFASALRQVKLMFSTRPASAALRMQMDVTACYFYIGIVKNSYQLGWSEGRAAREQVKELFLASLFHAPETVLAAMEHGTLPSRDRALDRTCAGQVRKALRESFTFALAKTCSRKIKLWQRIAA